MIDEQSGNEKSTVVLGRAIGVGKSRHEAEYMRTVDRVQEAVTKVTTAAPYVEPAAALQFSHALVNTAITSMGVEAFRVLTDEKKKYLESERRNALLAATGCHRTTEGKALLQQCGMRTLDEEMARRGVYQEFRMAHCKDRIIPYPPWEADRSNVEFLPEPTVKKRDGTEKQRKFNDERVAKLKAEYPHATFIWSDGSVAGGNAEGAAAALRYVEGVETQRKMVQQVGPPVRTLPRQ